MYTTGIDRCAREIYARYWSEPTEARTIYSVRNLEQWRLRAKSAYKRKGITLEDIAHHMGLSAGQVSHWFTGRRDIWLSQFFRLAEYIMEDPITLLTGVSQPGTPTQDQVDSAVAKIVAAQPYKNPDHNKFMKTIRKQNRARRVKTPTKRRKSNKAV